MILEERFSNERRQRMGERFGHRDLSAEQQLGREQMWRSSLVAGGLWQVPNRHMCARRCVESLTICEGEPGEAQGGCPFDQLFGVAGALQEGAAAFDPQGHVGGALIQDRSYS